MIPGIDVSHYQGVIDWQKVKESGIGFAYVKCTDGAIFADPAFLTNMIASRVSGITRGAYHFLRNTNIAEQIQSFSLKAGAAIEDLPPVCDAEVSGLKADDVLTFLDAFPGSILYTDLAMIKEWGAEAEKLTGHRLWLAHYVVPGSLNAPVTAEVAGIPWSAWTFWQHTPSGRVPGISTPVDLDWFNGTLEDLLSLTKVTFAL